jgi:hypothetical protein
MQRWLFGGRGFLSGPHQSGNDNHHNEKGKGKGDEFLPYGLMSSDHISCCFLRVFSFFQSPTRKCSEPRLRFGAWLGASQTALRRVSTLSDPRLVADSPEHVLQPATASLRRSRRRLWNVSQRSPIPTAVLSMTTESVPAGTARSVTCLAACKSASVAALTGPRDPGEGRPCALAAARSESRLPVS